MTIHREDHPEPAAPEPDDEATPPHGSPAEGGDTEPAERPPRPSQAEGERSPD
jgi:hypothetical protein